MALDLNAARALVANPLLWPRVRDYLAAGGAMLDFTQPANRLKLLDEDTRRQIALWLDALSKAAQWKTVVDGATVRQLKADYPGVYPEIFRFLPYFAKFDLATAVDQPDVLKCLLKLKFPDAFTLCYS